MNQREHSPGEESGIPIMDQREETPGEESDILLIHDTVPIEEECDVEVISISSHSQEKLDSDPVDLAADVKSEDHHAKVEEAPSECLVSNYWNVEDYRNPFETDEHWELRRKFMEQHKSAIPEDELVPLAQAFSNTVLLRSVYSEELTARSSLLGGIIAKEYHDSKSHQAAKFTVPASEAVFDWRRQISEGQKIAQRKKLAAQMLQPVIPITSIEDVFRNFILLDDDLDASGREFGMLDCGLFVFRSRAQERKQWEGTITAAGYQLSKSVGANKKAKLKCREDALKLLRRRCYKIKTNPNRCWDSCNVERLESTEDLDLNGSPFGSSSKPQPSKDQLKEDNIGFQMLKKLGWGGGPLGKHKDGIVDPIEVQAKRGRKGFGLPQLTPKSSTSGSNYPNDFLTDGFNLQNEAFRIDVNFYRDLMLNFRARRLGYDLVFSVEFTEIERALLCKIATDLNLQCRTITYDYEHYQLVLLKHRIPPHDLLVKILVERHPIYSTLYTVDPPDEDIARHNKLLELCSR